MSLRDWISYKKPPQISASTLHKALAETPEKLFLLDVRTATEWQKSHINGSVNQPLFTLQTHILPKDKLIVCICLSAHRSTPIARKLLRKGYHVAELEGGMLSWWKRSTDQQR